jgi:hypothetical protein
MTTMMRLVLGIAGVAAALCLDIRSSQALYGDAPWCAVVEIGDGEVEWDCEYQTIEQCRPNVVAGNRGFCNLNPYNAAVAAGPPAHAKHALRRHPHHPPHQN